ncbi:MAG: hypothetical protein HZB29_12260 [Nitrospinae bacterium]|nr:hypothetical protein [Nitrospinota bacterium]
MDNDSDDDAQIENALKNITLPFCTKNVNKAILSFSSAIIRKGVSKQLIMDALTELKPQLGVIAREFNDECHGAITRFNHMREQESLITDFLGKALLAKVEPLFPDNADLEAQVLAQPVNGVLPRQISSGLADAVRLAHGSQTIEENEKAVNARAEKYRRKTDNLIDFKTFLEDKEVCAVADRMIAQLKGLLDQKSDRDKRNWLLDKISAGADFKKMKRDLTESEYQLMVNTLFGGMQPAARSKGILKASV